MYLDYKTVDFVIDDEEHLFAFINFINVSLTVSNFKSVLTDSPSYIGLTKCEEIEKADWKVSKALLEEPHAYEAAV